MPKHRIDYVPGEADALVLALETSVTSYNMDVTGHHEAWPIAFRVQNEDGTLAGGITGHVWGNWMYISWLWVHPARRHQGIASSLLREAERFALTKGCRDAYVSTHEFQAPELYQEHGYRVFGQLEDYPAGHRLFFLQKQLTPAT